MPVSKKRKKDGRPVQRKVSTPAQEAEHAHGPEAEAPSGPQRLMGRPANPFVAQQQHRSSQRGR
jgi:hypothetical protein